MNLICISLAILFSVLPLSKNAASDICEPIVPTVILLSNGISAPITVEEYVAGVVAHEMPYTFSEEALKAQAVAARTYLYYCLLNDYHSHESADVCTDITHCSGYITESQLADRFGATHAKKAIDAARNAAYSTVGEILVYDNAPILALWHSSSHGYTEDCSAVFGEALPYLISVTTAEVADTHIVSFSVEDIKARLKTAGYKYDGASNVSVTHNSTGRCATFKLGNTTLDGRTARTVFGLRSTDFTAQFMGGRLYFFVSGYGHGVGMSQYGADFMAQNGTGYKEILTHYYSGAVIVCQ